MLSQPLLVVVARWIVVDAYLMIILGILVVAVAVEVWLNFWLQDSLQGRELAHLLGVEVGWFIENETVSVAQNVGREPSVQAQAAGADDRSETTLHEGLTGLEVLACDRHLGLLGKFPHGRNVNRSIRSTHDERSTLGKGCVSVAHGWGDVLAVVGLHRSLESCQCAVNLHIHRYVDFGRCSPCYHDA